MDVGPLPSVIELMLQLNMRDLDPSQYGEPDRREVDPPIEVETATWSAGGTLDRWVKERQQWMGRVRVQMVVNGGSKLLIFGQPKRLHSRRNCQQSERLSRSRGEAAVG